MLLRATRTFSTLHSTKAENKDEPRACSQKLGALGSFVQSKQSIRQPTLYSCSPKRDLLPPLGIVIGSVAALAILALLALLLARRSEQSKIARMQQRSRNSEPLTTALIGKQGFRAPVASHVRTRPGLEGESYQ